MCKTKNSLFLLFLVFVCKVNGLGIFHESSKIVFSSNDKADDLFGYSIILNENLKVGAPKGVNFDNPHIMSGAVYNCDFDLENRKNASCKSLEFNVDTVFARYNRYSFFRDDMWFGATMLALPYEDEYVVCAPRWTTQYSDKHLLAYGACVVGPTKLTMAPSKQQITVFPLSDRQKLAFVTDGTREDYGPKGVYLNYYAYAQAGMSLHLAGNNTVVFGAPGLLQWTGGIAERKVYVEKRKPPSVDPKPVMNPYFNKFLGPDDYFGYSIASGVFDDKGTMLYVAGAPRSGTGATRGFGQVLIFEPASKTNTRDTFKVRYVKVGPHLGSYFGASLLCVDINGDDRLDLLVGAPTYVAPGDYGSYDQGAVFASLNQRSPTDLYFQDEHILTGSAVSGARFGTSMASLGDINGDGYNDVAIGAPWENNGESGAVYIYKGSSAGLRTKYSQKIQVEESNSFGFFISNAYDIDKNYCNDFAVGAPNSGKAYLFRCRPTAIIKVLINVPRAVDLAQNATKFDVEFCILRSIKREWNTKNIELKATISVKSDNNGASLLGDPEFNLHINRDLHCVDRDIEVKPNANLTKPIKFIFKVEEIEENSQTFPSETAILSDISTLHATYDIKLTRDCGSDFKCNPLLKLEMKPFVSLYVPGSNQKLGLNIKVFNDAEPGYDTKVIVHLPLEPKRVPSGCSYRNLEMTCLARSPLNRLESDSWDIEFEYFKRENERNEIKIRAKIHERTENDEYEVVRVISESKSKELVIVIEPVTNLWLNGIARPNITMPVKREKLYNNGNVTFVHSFTVKNHGPSDRYFLKPRFIVPEMANISNELDVCDNIDNCEEEFCEEPEDKDECVFDVPANATVPLSFNYIFDLGKYGEYFSDHPIMNFTTIVWIKELKMNASVTTTLILEPAQPYWPIIVGLVAGTVVLILITYVLSVYGFFTRLSYEDMKRLHEESSASSLDTLAAGEASTNCLDLDENSEKGLLQSDNDD